MGLKFTIGLVVFGLALIYSLVVVPVQYFSCIGKGGVPVEQIGYIACVAGLQPK
jgi:hypothetical protein